MKNEWEWWNKNIADSHENKLGIKESKTEIIIEITPLNIKNTKINHFKTWIWKYFLPTEIRLHIRKEKK